VPNKTERTNHDNCVGRVLNLAMMTDE
jgi:hypothetical protein